MSSKSDIAQALAGLLQQQAVPPPPMDQSQMIAAMPQTNQLLPNAGLEAQAQGEGQMPMHPLIAAIAQHLGLMNAVRNRANQQMTADQSTTP